MSQKDRARIERQIRRDERNQTREKTNRGE